MPDRHQLRSWVLRTIGHEGSSLNDITHHFSVQHPDHEPSDLHEILQNELDIVREGEDRLLLTDEARRELEEISRHDASRRARD